MSNEAWVIISTGVVFFLATCWAIFDIARKDFGRIEKKAMWGIITLIPFIGPVVYFSMGIRKGKKP